MDADVRDAGLKPIGEGDEILKEMIQLVFSGYSGNDYNSGVKR